MSNPNADAIVDELLLPDEDFIARVVRQINSRGALCLTLRATRTLGIILYISVLAVWAISARFDSVPLKHGVSDRV